MDVVLVRWPEDVTRLGELRASGTPRLLLVAPEAEPPTVVDAAEDWIRLPAEDRDVRARVTALANRSGGLAVPEVDDDGLVRFHGQWVALSPVERALATALIARFGAVVGRDVLTRRAWPEGSPTRNALDVHMLRLRRRLADLGLEVRTVRARGYLLQVAGG
ncbi:MAG: winged helix-turn-helix domain-containing protein [Acidimicrobiia bacterium]